MTQNENIYEWVDGEPSPRRGHLQPSSRQLWPVTSGKPGSWSVTLKRVPAAYNRPEQRDTQTRKNWEQVVFNNVYPEPGTQQLLHPWEAAAVPTRKPPSEAGGGHGWALPLELGHAILTPCRDKVHSLSGQRGGRGGGRVVVMRDGKVSILLLRRQRALHGLIKMPIKGLRR